MLIGKAKEKNLEPRLREKVKRLGGLAIKFFCVSFTGFPDRMVLMPGGLIWFVELKSQGKTRSPRQRVVTRLLARLGFKVRLVDSEESLQAFLNEIDPLL
jgi:hypothetical protein